MAFKELRIKVSAEQKKESVTLASDGRLLVSVRDKREDGNHRHSQSNGEFY